MAKIIKLSDDLYDKLADSAQKSFRPITSHIEYLLSLEKKEVETPIVQAKTETTPEPKVQQRIKNNIHSLSEEASNDAGELLAERGELVLKLRQDNLAREIQKMAVDNYWTDEECHINMEKLKAKYEARRDEITEQLKNLGML